jgi:hypothetical protein
MFETCVKQLVKVTLTNQPVTMEFHGGSLFVSTITEDQARSVFHALSKSLGLGKVEIHPIGSTGEFAYDFVA